MFVLLFRLLLFFLAFVVNAFVPPLFVSLVRFVVFVFFCLSQDRCHGLFSKSKLFGGRCFNQVFFMLVLGFCLPSILYTRVLLGSLCVQRKWLGSSKPSLSAWPQKGRALGEGRTLGNGEAFAWAESFKHL